jgi:16S rRNA (cytosine1402-N4)-methyltransferase
MPEPAHVPVMAQRVCDWLVTDPRGTYWDATVGAAGHARVVIERLTEGGKLFGSDRDPKALALARTALTEAPVTLVPARFSELKDVWRNLKVEKLSGILFDFGVGSFQLADGARGIAFELDGPLDMRLDLRSEPLMDRLNRTSALELEEVIRTYGEERQARSIARAIVRRQPLETTAELRDAVQTASSPRFRQKTMARVFQALRIWVNEELHEIEAGLLAMKEMLAAGGRIVAISYHSLEDRRVKQFFRDESRDCLCPPELPACRCGHTAWLRRLTPRPEVAEPEEIAANRRARSAKMRVAERLK